MTETADVSDVAKYSEYADIVGAATGTFGEVQPDNSLTRSQTVCSIDLSEAGPSNRRHTRTFSNETMSTDPLQWDEERFEQVTADLVQQFGDVQINDQHTVSSADSVYISTYHSGYDVYFCLADGQEITTSHSEWTPAVIDDPQTASYMYIDLSFGRFYTCESPSGGTGESSQSVKHKHKKDNKSKDSKRKNDGKEDIKEDNKEDSKEDSRWDEDGEDEDRRNRDSKGKGPG
ncbi:hypothetical protein EDB80DRAFT_676351 [Ilyonectria destructans]|nr:hypothetical protein EDB80DRAFT_676351 [Ilyonectria destructans]